MMMGLVTIEGIGKQLEPTSDSFGKVARYLIPRVARERRVDNARDRVVRWFLL